MGHPVHNIQCVYFLNTLIEVDINNIELWKRVFRCLKCEIVRETRENFHGGYAKKIVKRDKNCSGTASFNVFI